MRFLLSLGLTLAGFIPAMLAVGFMMGDPKPGVEAVRWPAVPLSLVALACWTSALCLFVGWIEDLAARVRTRNVKNFRLVSVSWWRLAEWASRWAAIGATLLWFALSLRSFYASRAGMEQVYGVTLSPSAVVLSQKTDLFLEGDAIVRLPKRDLKGLLAQLKPGLCGSTGAASFGFPPGSNWRRANGDHRLYLCAHKPGCAFGSSVLFVDVAPEQAGSVQIRLATIWND